MRNSLDLTSLDTWNDLLKNAIPSFEGTPFSSDFFRFIAPSPDNLLYLSLDATKNIAPEVMTWLIDGKMLNTKAQQYPDPKNRIRNVLFHQSKIWEKNSFLPIVFVTAIRLCAEISEISNDSLSEEEKKKALLTQYQEKDLFFLLFALNEVIAINIDRFKDGVKAQAIGQIENAIKTLMKYSYVATLNKNLSEKNITAEKRSENKSIGYRGVNGFTLCVMPLLAYSNDAFDSAFSVAEEMMRHSNTDSMLAGLSSAARNGKYTGKNGYVLLASVLETTAGSSILSVRNRTGRIVTLFERLIRKANTPQDQALFAQGMQEGAWNFLTRALLNTYQKNEMTLIAGLIEKLIDKFSVDQLFSESKNASASLMSALLKVYSYQNLPFNEEKELAITKLILNIFKKSDAVAPKEFFDAAEKRAAIKKSILKYLKIESAKGEDAEKEALALCSGKLAASLIDQRHNPMLDKLAGKKSTATRKLVAQQTPGYTEALRLPGFSKLFSDSAKTAADCGADKLGSVGCIVGIGFALLCTAGLVCAEEDKSTLRFSSKFFGSLTAAAGGFFTTVLLTLPFTVIAAKTRKLESLPEGVSSVFGLMKNASRLGEFEKKEIINGIIAWNDANSRKGIFGKGFQSAESGALLRKLYGSNGHFSIYSNYSQLTDKEKWGALCAYMTDSSNYGKKTFNAILGILKNLLSRVQPDVIFDKNLNTGLKKLGCESIMQDSITMEALKNPVVITDAGNSFESDAIQELKDKNKKPVCPLTRKEIRFSIPNLALLKFIQIVGKKGDAVTATDVRPAFLDPFTNEVMTDPVIVTQSGFTVDRTAYDLWKQCEHTSYLNTTEPLLDKPIPNLMLKQLGEQLDIIPKAAPAPSL